MSHTIILKNIKGIIQDHIDLCDGLGSYVELVCLSRDPSHGYEHMKEVARKSLIIFNEMYDDIVLVSMSKTKFCSLLLTISWLHDVADRKYDCDGSLKILLKEFISNMFGEDTDLILNIIACTSYSNEIGINKDNVTNVWINQLGIDGTLLRNIVSDADKIEAMGYQGVVRCMTYNIELLKKKNIEITYENLILPVKIHAQEKLFKLCDNFVRTTPGKRMAEPLHKEMIETFDNDIELYNIYNKIILE